MNREISKHLSAIRGYVCQLTEGGNEEILDLLRDILATLTEQDELLRIDFCSEGAYTGSVIKVWDEESNDFGDDIYLNNEGTRVEDPPGGERCPGQIDYEYEFITNDKCLSDGTGVKEVLALTYSGGEEVSSFTFWIVNGSKVTTNPGVVECEPEKRYHIDNEVIPFTPGTPQSLTVPSGANYAELQFQNSEISYNFDSDPLLSGIRIANFGRLELESSDELSKFLFVAQSTGQVVVNYFFSPSGYNA